MGQALKVIKFDSDDSSEYGQDGIKNSNFLFNSPFVPINIAAISTAILGIISLVLEVHLYFQFRYEIYLARLIPTLVSLVTVSLLLSNFGKKNYKILTHVYIFTILSSLSFVSLRLPNMFGFSLMGASIFILALSLFVNWGRKNQIAAAAYLMVLFGIAALLTHSHALADQSITILIPSAVAISVISVFTSIMKSGTKVSLNTEQIDNYELENDNLQINREFFSNSVVPLFRCDIEGNFDFINGAFRELLNFGEESNSEKINFFNDIIKNDKVRSHFLKKIENKGKVEAYRFKYEDRNGHEEIFLMDCRSSMEDSKLFIEGSLRNITKQYKNDKALRQEIEKLQDSKRPSAKIIPSIENKAQKKPNVISKMGHELRTPMNSVLGFLTLIENGLFENDEELKEFSHSAKLSAESLLGLLNDVVEIAKIQDGLVEAENNEFNLLEELNRLTEELIPHFELKELEFEADFDQNIPDQIISDKLKYLQILKNLLRNAINVTESGKITLSVSCKKLSDNKIKLITIIEDSSEGMDDNELEKLMNDGYEKKDKNAKITSSLLHVRISKELINLLNGKISAESEVGKGTKFTFELEIESGNIQKETEDSNDSAKEVNFNAKAKLLLVEDNPISRKVEQKLLQEAGYGVDCIDTASEAIELVGTGSYDLVLMDIELKDMNGLEATKAIRELPDNVKDIPIIAVTAHSSMKDREKCLLAGMNDYISKPINITFLKMTIDQWINSASAEN